MTFGLYHSVPPSTRSLRLKPILSSHISSEEFTFLHNRQIHEAIGSVLEALHSLKTKKLKGAILKIELAKSFDRVSWLYIKMILTHLGFPLPFINWIMCCISLASFSVLINGLASHFFHVEQGLWQGCPLSPLLSLIVMEGLNRLFAFSKHDGRLQGLEIFDQCFLTHLLFVDDVLFFLHGTIRDTSTFYDLLNFLPRPLVWKPTTQNIPLLPLMLLLMK